MFGVGQCAVEYLDDLHWAELTGVVFDPGPAGARAGFVSVDPEHAHQLTLDRLAQDRLAMENRVLQFDRADTIANHPPAGYPFPIAVIADRAVSVACRQSGRHLHARLTARCGIQQRRHMFENLAWTEFRGVEP